MPVFVGAGTSSFLKDTDGVGIAQRTTTQINNMSGMVAGQIVYDSTAKLVKFYDGTSWFKVSSAIPTLTGVSGNIYVGQATTLTLTGTNFLTSGLVVNFLQTDDSIDVNVTVTPASDTSATVTVPASVYNSVTAGRVVTIKVTNSDGAVSGTQTKTAAALPSGGTKTTAGGYTYHTFTSSGNFVNTVASLSTEWLLVAGGGGGGSGDDGAGGGSGGGAGGAIDGTSTLSAATYAVVVGGGGGGGNRNGSAQGANGSNSTFNSNTAIGGGRGVDWGGGPNAGNGGSGAGGFRTNGAGSGTAGQGNNGGAGANGSAQAGGGGGGKNGAGGPGNNGVGGSGGAGINWKSLGTTYAGGGGAGGDNTAGSPYGGGVGQGGGGNGTPGGYGGNNPNNATANRGGGGGGTGAGTGTFYRGSNGGSGIFIIRYSSL